MKTNHMYLYHGTSLTRAMSIMEFGFRTEHRIWDVSDECMTYFYDLDKVAESMCDEDDGFEDKRHYALEQANGNAQIANALQKNPDAFTVVFEVAIDLEAIHKGGYDEELEIMEDDSCENMAGAGAIQIRNEVVNEWISKGYATLTVFKFHFYPKLSFFYLMGVSDEYLQDSMGELEWYDIEALKAIRNTGLSIYEILDEPNEESDRYTVSADDFMFVARGQNKED